MKRILSNIYNEYLLSHLHSLQKSKLSFSTIFEELPIVVHNSHLVTALLHELDTPLADPARLRSLTSFNDATVSIRLAEENSPLTPNFEVLDLELDPFMEKNLEDLLDCTEAQHQEQNNYMYWQRSVAREQAKVQQFLIKRVCLFVFIIILFSIILCTSSPSQ